MDSASLKRLLFLVSDNQAVGTNFTINSPESLYTGLSFCLDTKGRVGNVSRSRGIYGSLLSLVRPLVFSLHLLASSLVPI